MQISEMVSWTVGEHPYLFASQKQFAGARATSVRTTASELSAEVRSHNGRRHSNILFTVQKGQHNRMAGVGRSSHRREIRSLSAGFIYVEPEAGPSSAIQIV
jgi:hypothetical protein